MPYTRGCVRRSVGPIGEKAISDHEAGRDKAAFCVKELVYSCDKRVCLCVCNALARPGDGEQCMSC